MVAETSTSSTSPPSDSTCTSYCNSSVRTRSGFGVGLVDLVDRHDHRHLRGLGVIDRLDGLRHHAVIRRDHQDHQIGDLRAARAHRGKRRVAGRVDEGDLAALGRGHLIGADVLGDAAGLAAHHVGLADRVEQRGLAVVDMAHDGHDRRTRLQGRGIVGRVEQTFLHVRFGDTAHRVAQFFGDELGGVGVDRVGDLRHVTLLHQDLDDVDTALRHAVREFLDRDRFRDRDLALQLFLVLGVAMAGHALRAAAERCDRTLAHFVGRQCRDERQTAALLRGARARRLRGSGGPYRGTAHTAPRRTAIVILGFRRQ